MLRQLLIAFKGSETLDNAYDEFTEMLEYAEWMFDRANEVLRREVEPAEIKDSLYKTDQAINTLIRSIRRKIIRHLTINPGTEVGASMVLMSVAKDAERIGDYCKNVFEVGQFYKEDFHVPGYHEPLEEIRANTQKMFAVVREAFNESSVKKADKAAASAAKIRTKCDMIIEQLLLDASSISTHEAVAYSLLARHYKRVAAHLANIASAVRGKIEDLDFS